MALSMDLVPLAREDVLLALKEYEAAYGVPSSERDSAFTDENGTLRETEDWRSWDSLCAVWARAFADSTVSA